MSTYDLFNDFDEFFTLGLGRPTHIRFNTPNTKDLMPSYWSKWTEENVIEEATDDKEAVTEIKMLGYKAVCRTVGVDEGDIKITTEDYGICLDGKTIVDGSEYSQHIELPISKDVMANITEINYKSKNGLTYIYVKVREPEYKKIEISRI